MKWLIVFVLCLSLVSAGDVYYYHNDHLGSPRVLVSSDREVVWSGDYSEFGSSTGEGELMYNVKELDSSGLYYYGARFYSPLLGRFVSADSVEVHPSPYVYVGNNPMVMVDPSGNYELSKNDLNMFKGIAKKNLFIAGKLAVGAELSNKEKVVVLNYVVEKYAQDYPYASDYLDMFLNSERTSTLPERQLFEKGGSLPTYDVSEDWNEAGFNEYSIKNVFKYARKASKNPAGILEQYNGGKEALLYREGHHFSPLKFEAMGFFSFYIKKSENKGKAILFVKDTYDWSGTLKYHNFGADNDIQNIAGAYGLKKGQAYGIKDYGVAVHDSEMIGLGQPYNMYGEWEVDEEEFLKQNWGN